MNTHGSSRILVVDDDDWIISGVSVALTAAGFEVASACNGKEGLKAVLQDKPRLIITDVVMPEMDGWEFVRHLRANPEFTLIPVLFLTTRMSAQDRISGFQLGADDYLGKPVNLPELPRRVMKALAMSRRLAGTLTLPRPAASRAKGLKGSLDQVGMATLLGVLCNGRHSGILRLTRGILRDEALVYLVLGEVHRVELQNKGKVTGDDALQKLFQWLGGEFEFTPMPLRVANEVNVPMTALLLRGASLKPVGTAAF